MGFDIDDGGFACVEGLLKSTLQPADFVDGDAKASHGFGHFGKVCVWEEPEFVRAFGTTAIGVFYTTLFLVQRMVVVDDGDGVDFGFHGGVEFGHVIPDAPIASEANDGTVWCGAFGTEGLQGDPSRVNQNSGYKIVWDI